MCVRNKRRKKFIFRKGKENYVLKKIMHITSSPNRMDKILSRVGLAYGINSLT